MDATDYEFIQTCNCIKDERKRLAVRRYAGVFVIVLPCGHIVHVHHLVGSESLQAKPLQLLTIDTIDGEIAVTKTVQNSAA